MAKYKEPDVAQLRFVPINFAELFTSDHPLTQLVATIRKLDLSEFDAGYKNDTAAGGRPADSCERILAIIVYSLLYGGISMRNLQRELAVRADLLYLSGGMNIDHTTFCVFRKRHREAILKLFSQTVFVGAQAGLIDLDIICIDSTKIRAWASRHDIGDREELARRYQHIQELCEKRYAEWDACQNEEEKKAIERRNRRLARRRVKLEEALQFLKDHPERKRIHLHEPDADIQKDWNQGFVIGYTAQLAVDSKSQMIVFADVVAGQSDAEQTVSIVEAVEEQKPRLCEKKTDEVKYVLDCGYSSGENLRKLEDRDVFMPDRDFARLKEKTGKPEILLGTNIPTSMKEQKDRLDPKQRIQFIFDRDRDCFVCPRQGVLTFRRERALKGESYRNYRKTRCGKCELRTRCIGPSRTRKDLWIRTSWLNESKAFEDTQTGTKPPKISRHELKAAMRAKLSTPRGRAIYGKRFPVSEGVFATVKGLRKGNRFLRRGLDRVNEEWAERCIAHNLAKMSGFTLCRLMEC
jgi:transposase